MLRQTVVYQIGFWDTALASAQAVQGDLVEVLGWVNYTSITANDCMNLSNLREQAFSQASAFPPPTVPDGWLRRVFWT